MWIVYDLPFQIVFTVNQATWIGSAEISTGVLMDAELGNPAQISALIEASNTAHAQVYLFKDSGLQPQISYYYWLMAIEDSGINQVFGPIHVTLEGDTQSPELPVKTNLDKLYPNPFNPILSIHYGLKEAADLNLSIYNLKVQKVHTLEVPNQNKGYHNCLWDVSGQASGVYFLVFESSITRQMRRVTLSK